MRDSWDLYFLKQAYLISERSTCIRRKVGALAVSNNHILATGYNGAPSGLEHCTAETCIRTKNNIPSGKELTSCKAVHAEQNVITQAAYHGISLKDSTLYCTTMPCSICAKMIINVGIEKIVISEFYEDKYALELLGEAKLNTVMYQMDNGTYTTIIYPDYIKGL